MLLQYNRAHCSITHISEEYHLIATINMWAGQDDHWFRWNYLMETFIFHWFSHWIVSSPVLIINGKSMDCSGRSLISMELFNGVWRIIDFNRIIQWKILTFPLIFTLDCQFTWNQWKINGLVWMTIDFNGIIQCKTLIVPLILGIIGISMEIQWKIKETPLNSMDPDH